MHLFQHKNRLFFTTFTLLVELKRFYRFFIQNNRHFLAFYGKTFTIELTSISNY